jgi:hypothetical protein
VLQSGVSMLGLCKWCFAVAADRASAVAGDSAFSRLGQEFESQVLSSTERMSHVGDVLDGGTST